MHDRDQAETGSAQNRPGQPNLEEVLEQRRLESERQAMEAAALARAHLRG